MPRKPKTTEDNGVGKSERVAPATPKGKPEWRLSRSREVTVTRAINTRLGRQYIDAAIEETVNLVTLFRPGTSDDVDVLLYKNVLYINELDFACACGVQGEREWKDPKRELVRVETDGCFVPFVSIHSLFELPPLRFVYITGIKNRDAAIKTLDEMLPVIDKWRASLPDRATSATPEGNDLPTPEQRAHYNKCTDDEIEGILDARTLIGARVLAVVIDADGTSLRVELTTGATRLIKFA